MDEAVLRIVVKDEGGVDSSLPSEEGPSYRSNPPPPYQAAPPPVQNNIPPPTPRSPAERPAASASQPFNPQAEAQRIFDAEVRREQIKQVYERMYGSAQDTKNAFDATLDLALKMRGTLGGIFGTVAGATLDVISAVRSFRAPARSAAQLEARWRNANHFAEGGEIPPYPGVGPDEDNVPILAKAGEGVVTKEAMQDPENKAAVEEMNAGIPSGWGSIDAGKQYEEPKLNLSDQSLSAIKKSSPLEMPPHKGVDEKFISSAWDIVSRLWPEMARNISRIGEYDPSTTQGELPNAFVDPSTGVLAIRPQSELSPSTLWHELVHVEQKIRGAIDKPRNEMDPNDFNELESEAVQRQQKSEELFERFRKFDRGTTEVTGSSGVDKVPAMLTAGEGVVNKSAMDIPENKTAVAEMNAGRIPAEQQEIFATAKEALIAVGQTQKEADQVLQKVLQTADKVFATAQEVITAAYKTPETAKREESQRKEEIKPPEPYGPSRKDRPEAENVAEDLYNAQQEEFDAEVRSAPDRSMEERRKQRENELDPILAQKIDDRRRQGMSDKDIDNELNPEKLPEASAAPAESGIDMAAIGEAAEGPLAIVGAVIESVKVLREAAVGAAQELGDFAVAVANPDANPSTVFKEVGSRIKDQTGGWINAGNLIGIFGPAVGEATTQVGRFMDAVKGAADRYAEYSPQISQAQALAEIQQTMGDLRRVQEGGPELARYIQMQSNMQQKFEDIKIKLLTNILKIMTPLMSILEKLMPAGDTIGSAIDQVAAPLVLLATIAGEIAGLQRDALTPDIMDPTSLITNVATGTAGPGLTLPPNT